MGFDSYYWQVFSLPKKLTEHRERLSSGEEGADDFLALLRSGNPVARGVALDQYKQAEALTRFGGPHPYGQHSAAVLDVARHMLMEPPYPGDEDVDEPARNHASALLVLAHLATTEDSDLIAGILRRSPSPEVIGAAGQAAACALMASEVPSEALVGVLGEILLDEDRRTRERLDALHPFTYLNDDGVGAILARAARTSDEKVQAEVVGVLINNYLTPQRDVIDDITADWARSPSRLQAHILRALEMALSNHNSDRGQPSS